MGSTHDLTKQRNPSFATNTAVEPARAEKRIAEIDATTPRAERWLTSAEAAQYLGITPSDLARKRMNGVGPQFAKLGNAKQAHVRYLQSHLDAFMAAKMRTSTSEIKESA